MLNFLGSFFASTISSGIELTGMLACAVKMVGAAAAFVIGTKDLNGSYGALE